MVLVGKWEHCLQLCGQDPDGGLLAVTGAEPRWENKGGHVGSIQGGAQQEVTCAKPGWGGAQWEVTWAEPRLEGCPARGHVGSVQAGAQWEVTCKGLLHVDVQCHLCKLNPLPVPSPTPRHSQASPTLSHLLGGPLVMELQGQGSLEPLGGGFSNSVRASPAGREVCPVVSVSARWAHPGQACKLPALLSA